MLRLFSTAFILVILTVCASPSVKGQRPGPEFRRSLSCEPLEPRTKLEGIEWRYEHVLLKGFTQIATINTRGADIRVDAVELKDSDANMRALGLAISLRETTEGSSRENRSLLDYEEIDRLLRGMDAVSRVNESMTKLVSFEARYKTLGDLEIAVFRQSRSSGTAVSVSSGLCDRVTALLTLDELDRLKAHIIEAKMRLDEIK